jgi:hypothetical protein
MLRGISWKEFVEIMIVLLVIYYFFILLIYYRKDIARISKEGIRKRKLQDKQPTTKNISSSLDSASKNEPDTILFSAVHDLMEELKEIFSAASDKHFLKQELLVALQIKLRSYQQLKGTPFQVAVNNHVVQQSKEYCDISLDDIEVKQIW